MSLRARLLLVRAAGGGIYVHGYEIARDVPAGGTITFTFDGAIEGRSEVEIEETSRQIATLDVAP